MARGADNTVSIEAVVVDRVVELSRNSHGSCGAAVVKDLVRRVARLERPLAAELADVAVCDDIGRLAVRLPI